MTSVKIIHFHRGSSNLKIGNPVVAPGASVLTPLFAESQPNRIGLGVVRGDSDGLFLCPGGIGLPVAKDSALLLTKETVNVHGLGVQTLADHETGFGPLVGALEEVDLDGEDDGFVIDVLVPDIEEERIHRARDAGAGRGHVSGSTFFRGRNQFGKLVRCFRLAPR